MNFHLTRSGNIATDALSRNSDIVISIFISIKILITVQYGDAIESNLSRPVITETE